MAGQPQSLSITEDEAGRRLDLVLAARLGEVSRAKIQKLIARGAVTVNGVVVARSKEPVGAGDVVELTWLEAEPSPLTPVPMELDILYEDEQLLVLCKPAGITVHPGAGDNGATLVQGLLYHAGRLGQPEVTDPTAWLRPGIVHRLDKDTSGVMVVAKTDKAHAALARQFHDKTTLVREYAALLDGRMAQTEILYESYLHRDPRSRLKFASLPVAGYRLLVQEKGREPTGYRYARSLFKREQTYADRLTLARVRLFTGRTHQIRVHALSLGVPILGDQTYHRPTQLPQTFAPEIRAAVFGLSRQMLHARTLGFRHPVSGEAMHFEALYPPDFQEILALLAPYTQVDAGG